ncbi:MAG: type II toxin-antitoxin system HipA family toxin [Cyanobacteria bacterium TGS_CYA1]|nr:type II toxin-antitoxin system HipA family toxin [Cyanobacteria bacterium TGS_CYA1]
MTREQELGFDRTLEVWLQDKLVGHFFQLMTGNVAFQYVNDATKPLSISLPVRIEEYAHSECFAYFDGLLPESEVQREAIAKKFSINKKNSFRLLKAIGADCAGAVSFHSPREKVKSTLIEELKEIRELELEKLILDLPQNPLFISKHNSVRLSLAGAQPKAAIIYRDGKIFLPLTDTPTTHIIKPAIGGLNDTAANEYFCLGIARRLGIDTPKSELKFAGKTPYLLIERYDRKVVDGNVQRIHQEDFCQALNVIPSNKYESDGGPGVLDSMKLLFKTDKPVISRNKFMRMLFFNYLIGNMDAHGKNYSILHHENGSRELSPLYDTACTLVYAELERSLAMKIGGKYDPFSVFPRHWKRLCETVGYSYPAVNRALGNYCIMIPSHGDKELQLMEKLGFKTDFMVSILELIKENCLLTLKRLAAEQKLAGKK